ncbi:hypothetical protein ACXYRR_03335 [Mycoplasma sp. 246B]
MDIKKLERNDLINNIGKEQYTTNTEAGDFLIFLLLIKIQKNSRKFKRR